MIEKFYSFLLIFVRIFSYFFIAIPFSYEFIPIKVKIGLSVILSILLYSIIPLPTKISSIFDFISLFILQVIIGIILGFIVNLIFYSIEFASYFIDYMAGMGIVTTYGLSNESVPIIGNFLTIIAILVLFITDSHHILILGLKKSFFSIPISFNIPNQFITTPLYLYKNLFNIGLILAFPIVLPIFILEIYQSIIARIMPDLNIFIISLPMRILCFFLFLLPFLSVFPVLIIKLINNYIKVIIL
jgi:flagellar biosynthetic protein FliR